MTETKPGCPQCGSSSVVSIIYGEPAQEPSGVVAAGGCIVAADASRWACTGCRHRWGVASGYDFGNLADMLEAAVVSTMWSSNAAHQFEALGFVCDELEARGFALLDDEAAASRSVVVQLLDGASEATVCNLTDEQRDRLAEALLHLLRFAERKAANG